MAPAPLAAATAEEGKTTTSPAPRVAWVARAIAVAARAPQLEVAASAPEKELAKRARRGTGAVTTSAPQQFGW